MDTLTITVADCKCPTCGAEEVHPDDANKPVFERRLLVRGFKVYNNNHWWSQCLVCAGYYDAELKWLGNDAGNPDAGWF